ncbi:MAG: hypothetical protein Q8R67_12260 [Rhodoferax sp.]|nr:hypothetical protein [Rhodoferax sp.]MDP3652446.1 hypothetical protein [Rhodoferax sp.]
MSESTTQSNSGESAIQIGQVAGAVNIVQLTKLLTQMAEYQHQANFYAATGIRCGAKVRQQFDYLMEEHDFTSHELGRAWKTMALVARRTKEYPNLHNASRNLDLTVGWTGIAFFTFVFVFMLGQMITLLQQKDYQWVTFGIAIGLIPYLGSLVLFSRTFLIPQQTAKRAAEALKSIPTAKAKH